MGALGDMLGMQAALQAVFDRRAVSDDPQESCEYIKDMAYALEDEIHELTAETGWKPWSTSWHINELAAQGEWIDALHFMLNLANKLNLTEEGIVRLYNAKYAINKARAASKYDGVSTKCPECKRALDDPTTQCRVWGQGYWQCEKFGIVSMVPKKI